MDFKTRFFYALPSNILLEDIGLEMNKSTKGPMLIQKIKVHLLQWLDVDYNN